MFEPSDHPRVYAMPPGADFGTELVDGLLEKLSLLRPDQIARTEIYVNTARMARRIKDVFDQKPPSLLPRIRLVTDLANDPLGDISQEPVSPLYRRLELSNLVSRLLDSDPTLAPRSSLFELSDSLASLMEEMHGEGIDPQVFETLDVNDESGHWDRSRRFLHIVNKYFAEDARPDKEKKLRQVVISKIAEWQNCPPDHPIIVAGSTGSRGATGLFMQAVANLPQGAIILPGFDFDLPQQVWDKMDDPLRYEDHPQYRFLQIVSKLGISIHNVQPWSNKQCPNPNRNALISLSLRPAPVTDQWLGDGPKLGDLRHATEGLTLVEAPSQRAEAEAIALRLRQAAQDGQTAALITPDRVLTRQVTAALDRWDLTPDDSAGIPLQLSPPGRFLRQVANLFIGNLTGEALLSLLKHPLCNSTEQDRGYHLLQTRELELHLRRHGPAYPQGSDLRDWANGIVHAKRDTRIKVTEERQNWAAWIAGLIDGLFSDGDLDLKDWLTRHKNLTEAFASGPNAEGSGGLWAERAGREAERVVKNLSDQAEAAGQMNAIEYANLFAKVLSTGSIRDPEAGHPDILIWGTLEARVQSADLVILGGMNEGVWPEAAAPDPWLNRNMRKSIGLLLPERRIGLSAHDYQQAVASGQVWITRSKRDAEAETVPSRWVNRLVNLLGGLPEQHGKEALTNMRAQGDHWLAMANSLSQPSGTTPPAVRPSPRPPISSRPKEISVTEVKTLIRDPYAIYAKRVLGLAALDPLVPTADAPLRGVIIHQILEDFITADIPADAPDARDAFMKITNDRMVQFCPWPTVRAQWISRIEKSVEQFLVGEASRQSRGHYKIIEGYAKHPIGKTGVQLICKTDRIDLDQNGSVNVYDYKTGSIPTPAQQMAFDKQLFLTSALIELGAFDEIGQRPVSVAEFIAFNSDMRNVPAPLTDAPPSNVWDEFQKLIAEYNTSNRGYSARIAMQLRSDVGQYDHLSRFGEWDTSAPAKSEDLS